MKTQLVPILIILVTCIQYSKTTMEYIDSIFEEHSTHYSKSKYVFFSFETPLYSIISLYLGDLIFELVINSSALLYRIADLYQKQVSNSFYRSVYVSFQKYWDQVLKTNILLYIYEYWCDLYLYFIKNVLEQRGR